jgi:hypothetical protein
MSPAECLDWRVDLHAITVPPSTEQAAAIARAQAAFPGVRLHAIQLCSYIRYGEQKNVQPLCHRFVAESSCFLDDGPECLEEDPMAIFEVNQRHALAPEIYFGSAARDMLPDNEALTK